MLVQSMSDVRGAQEMETLKWQLKSQLMDADNDKETNTIQNAQIRDQVEMPLINAVYINKLKHESTHSQYNSFCRLQVSLFL